MNANAQAPDVGNVFAAMALVILPLAVLAPLSIAWAAAIPALWIAISYLRVRCYPWAGRGWLVPILLIGVVAYGALTILWSASPDRSLHIAVKLVPIVAGGWLLVGAAAQLDDTARHRVSLAFLIGAAVAIMIIGFEIVTNGAIRVVLQEQGLLTSVNLHHLNRAASLLAILVWPLWLILARRFGSAAAVAGVALAVIALWGLEPDTPLLAIFTGMIFLGLAYAAPRVAQWTMIAGVIVVALAMPLYPIVLPTLFEFLLAWNIGDLAVHHRFSIWNFAATNALDQPLFGWGLGSSRAVPGADEIATSVSSTAKVLPLHPHNALLQIWLELGVPGVLLAVAAMLAVLVAIPQHFVGRKEQAAALTVIFSATLIAELSYGIWQSWWLVFLWVLAALTIAIAGKPARTGAA